MAGTPPAVGILTAAANMMCCQVEKQTPTISWWCRASQENWLKFS
jgi:hypothetical protein